MAERELVKAEDYPSNSFKSKEGIVKTKREKIVKGSVKKRKKSPVAKAAAEIVQEDSQNVLNYIIRDVLIPAAQDTIFNVISGGLEMLLFGGETSGKGSSQRRGGYTSYSGYYDKKGDRKKARLNSRSAQVCDDLIFDNRREAEDVLSYMIDIVDEYTVVSVADLYDLVGEHSSFTDHKWGWDSLSSASVVRVRDGYALKLPRTVPID